MIMKMHIFREFLIVLEDFVSGMLILSNHDKIV